MDKNLKKLSRLELLEILVSLSEDYEVLAAEHRRLRKGYGEMAAENDRLRQAQKAAPQIAQASQRLPRTAKVGSIAEAALQANGFFDAAQRSADEYLRQIKAMRDELAKRVDSEALSQELSESVTAARKAENRAQASLRDAQMRANQAIERANAQAEIILNDARSRADEAVANANRQAHVIVTRAQRQAAQYSAQAQVQPSASAARVQGQPQMQARATVNAQAQQPQSRQQARRSDAGAAPTGEIPVRRGRHARIAVEGGA